MMALLPSDEQAGSQHSGLLSSARRRLRPFSGRSQLLCGLRWVGLLSRLLVGSCGAACCTLSVCGGLWISASRGEDDSDTACC